MADELHPCLQGACRVSSRTQPLSAPRGPPVRPPAESALRGWVSTQQFGAVVPLDELLGEPKPEHGDVAAGRTLGAAPEEQKEVKECLREWQQQLQRQLQEHQRETAKLVASVERHVAEQLAAGFDAIQEALGQQPRSVSKEQPLWRDAICEAEGKSRESMESTLLRVHQEQREWFKEVQEQHTRKCELKLAEMLNGVCLIQKRSRSSQELERSEKDRSHNGTEDVPSKLVEAVQQPIYIQTNRTKSSDWGEGGEVMSPNMTRRECVDVDGHAVEALHTALGWKACAQRQDSIIFDRFKLLSVVQHVSFVLIFANTLFLGFEAELGMQSALRRQKLPTWVRVTDTAFTVLFSVELCIKIWLERRNFFFGSAWRWNVFDCLLVWGSMMDVAFDMFNLSQLRSLRTIRAVRAARVLRMISFVRDLRLMIAAIISSTTSLFWALTLLLFMIYLFALFIMQGVQMYIRDNPSDNALPENLLDYWGSLGLSVLSLFMAISGGMDWGDLASPLWACNWVFILAFAAFITVMVFGILNILMAVFVEAASSIAEVDRDLVIQQQLSQNTSTVNAIKQVFRAADCDGSGCISRAELESVLRDEKTLAYLETLGLDISQARSFFTLLDLEGRDEVGIEELIGGIMRLKGAATGIDVATMMYESKRVYTHLNSSMCFLEDRLNQVANVLGIQDSPTNQARRSPKSNSVK